MKLLVCLITYNRLDYSKRTLDNLLETIKVPHYIVVVDNASTDGTQLYMADQLKEGKIDRFVANDTNLYPGAACNLGWTLGLLKYPEATHLMRLDNDFELKPGWDTETEKYFDKIPTLGQLGLDYEVMENPGAEGYEITLNGMTINKFPGNVGGTNVITKRVWDMGCRYDETPWHHDGGPYPTIQEDVKFSQEIQNKGFLMGHMTDEYARTFANKDNWGDFKEYYLKTMKERGYDDIVKKLEAK